MVLYCLHNPDMSRGEAIVSGKLMDCHDCLRKDECKKQKGEKKMNNMHINDKELKDSFTEMDVQVFDSLLLDSENPYIGYSRNIARLQLKNFLAKFTKDAKEQMAKQIGAKKVNAE